MSHSRAVFLLVSVFVVAWCLPGCGDEPWMNADVEATFNMQDGTTHTLDKKGMYNEGNIGSPSWFVVVLPDKEGFSFDIHFTTENLDSPGDYDVAQSDAVSLIVRWPNALGETDYGNELSGVVTIDEVDFGPTGKISGSFEQIMLEPWDEDDSNPCVSLTNGRFSAAPEGADQ